MTRRKQDPLRPLTEEEREVLKQIARAHSEPASHVARAKSLLAVDDGKTYVKAAQAAGRCSGKAVSQLVSRFNQEGLAAIELRHGGGPQPIYGVVEQERILAEVRRTPDREQDGTVTWSLTTLQRALRRAPDGLPQVSTYTIWKVLHQVGWSGQQDRTWCDTGKIKRKRKAGVVEVVDPDAIPKKNLIEKAYKQAEAMGLPVWCQDQAGPFQTKPYLGTSWQPQGQPTRQPHEYIRNGTAKLLTLFHPATGQVRAKGVTNCPNSVLHPWLKQELSAILATMPLAAQDIDPTAIGKMWAEWYAGLPASPTLPANLPPLRMLLVQDNLAGHKSHNFVQWCFSQGIALLYTPLGGSWLNMAESIQGIIEHRALNGQHPSNPEQIIEWLEATVRGWNKNPTSFVWGGKRAARRDRAHKRRQDLAGSGAYIHRIRPHISIIQKRAQARQVAH